MLFFGRVHVRVWPSVRLRLVLLTVVVLMDMPVIGNVIYQLCLMLAVVIAVAVAWSSC